ncbi:hypothetical protein CDAR_418721 [Caerostris darwini]|uniref:Uncharacterized protein n=1 Tax=Caerostris darwini TaxID=1538125 RepID=A0AAV4MWN0_9ARAC|nr:hypothetical protein CDAR_418721 [Caerostris darwini]
MKDSLSFADDVGSVTEKGWYRPRTMEGLFGKKVLLFAALVALALCPTAQAKKWTMEDLAAAKFPHRVSNDIYLDPCKSGECFLTTVFIASMLVLKSTLDVCLY